MERTEGLHFQAIEVALQAKALKECSFPGHSEWVLDQGDDEANRLAYAIGTNRWENGEIDGEREEFLDAIKHAIKGAPYDCPRCDRMMAKDCCRGSSRTARPPVLLKLQSAAGRVSGHCAPWPITPSMTITSLLLYGSGTLTAGAGRYAAKASRWALR